MNSTDPTEIFRLEAADLLGQIEEVVLGLERNLQDTESVHHLFRAFHTIKGSGAMFGFDAVAAFTHHVETVLDEVRNGALATTPGLFKLLMASRDQIQVLLVEPDNFATEAECTRIIAELATLRNSVTVPVASASTSAATPKPDVTASQRWRIGFQPAPAVAACGLDPVSLLRELRTLGRCDIEADLSRLPAIADLNPEQCHLSWSITLTTDRGLDAIKDVFIFLDEESRLSIEPLSDPLPLAAVPAAAPAKRVPETVEAGSARKAGRDSTVRVPSAKLDRLVNLVGEFVMNQSRLTQVSARLDDAALGVPVEAIERLVAELRDTVLDIRMMPIGSTFSRFKRLVHDLSHDLGKEVDLVTEGEDTEMDKTVLDQLGDPLVHLIRNCLDHAIEPPDERRLAGKSSRGTVRLAATHAGSHVILTIQDDGRGLNTDAIRTKAIEKNLIPVDAALSEKEIFNLIFLPGFSTAKQITSVSGRGVGMDVVKRQLDALRGGISLASQRGAGTTITLTLPLTLAIIDGLLVELAGDQFILPMAAVMENVELHAAERGLQNGRNVVVVRGEMIPYLSLRDLFGATGSAPAIEKVVIVRYEDQRVGLVVDRVLGSHQTVIQSLGRFYRRIEVCSGSTIMGDGRVALILDLDGLVRHAQRQAAHQPHAA